MRTASIFWLIVLIIGPSILVRAQSDSSEKKVPIINGMASYLPKPIYPRLPVDACVSGQVSIQVLLERNGRVKKAEAISGHPLLRKSAVQAAKLARFRHHGHFPAIELKGVLVYNFRESVGCKKRTIPTIAHCHGCKAISMPKPEYPSAARFVNASGRVFVAILVDERGNVISAKATSGHPLLATAAEEAAQAAKFEPFRLGKMPIRFRTSIVYDFSRE